MIPANGKIIVEVDPTQKKTMKVGESTVATMLEYESNYRYRSPTMAKVVVGNKVVSPGDILLIHHNLCPIPSPYHLQDDLFSIPFNKVIFARINEFGDLEPICGNMICEEIEVESNVYLPPEERKLHKNRYRILIPGWTKYKVGQVIFTRPSSGYQIIYNFNGEQRMAVKVDSDMVCGVLKTKQIL